MINLISLHLSIFRANLDLNKIESQGLKLLTKANFPELKVVFLCKIRYILAFCDLNNEGLKHLSKSAWPQLI